MIGMESMNFRAIVGSCLFVAVIVTTRGKPIESVTKSLYATLVCRAGACQASLFEVCIGELSISASIMRLDHERLNELRDD
jgi:hypothetical protein